MSVYRCPRCEDPVDLARHPLCPGCLARGWSQTRGFVREKHDPRKLPLAWQGYRSVLNPNLVAALLPHLLDAAQRGAWFHDTYYDMAVHYCVEPLGRHAGAGVPEGAREPDHSLDALLIAEANSPAEAHGFAVASGVFEAQLKSGEFVPLARCEVKGCGFLRLPGSSAARCILHANAREPETRGEETSER